VQAAKLRRSLRVHTRAEPSATVKGKQEAKTRRYAIDNSVECARAFAKAADSGLL
jgi:hypothetical protein